MISYNPTRQYDELVLPLLRRMSHLEELTLYIHILDGSTFISGTYLDNEILIHMPRLHTFTFYFASENAVAGPVIQLSNMDIERTFADERYRHTGYMVDYFTSSRNICYRVFSLPFKFDRLKYVTNNIPNIMFESVTYLKLRDDEPFKHEFFVRLARAFPFLKSLSIWNLEAPFFTLHEYHLRDKDWCSIVEYPHLISLNIRYTHHHYVEHLLNDTKTYLPRLTQLEILYDNLKTVTNNFTRDETRCNCAKVKRLIVGGCIAYPKEVYYYFPLL